MSVTDKEEYLEALRKLSPGDRLRHKLWCKTTMKRLRKSVGLANPKRRRRK